MEFESRLSDRDAWAIGDGCSAARALDLLSTKTTFMVIRECFYGTTRFDDFVVRIGASAPAVSRSLKTLEEAGVISRSPYQEPGRRLHDEYHLTAAGEDLLPVLLALIQWGDNYLQGGRPPLRFVDADTGHAIGVRVTVDDDGEPAVRSEDIKVELNKRPRTSSRS